MKYKHIIKNLKRTVLPIAILLGTVILAVDLVAYINPSNNSQNNPISDLPQSLPSSSLQVRLERINKEIAIKHNIQYNLVQRASILESTGNFSAALDDLNQVLLLQTDNPDILSSRARVQRLLGNYAASMQDLNRVLKINPNHSAALFNLALLLYGQGKFDEALQNLNKNIALNPAITILYFNRALVLLEINQTQAAIDDFTVFIDNSKNNVGNNQLVEIATQQLKLLRSPK